MLELSKDCQKCSHSTLQYVFERVRLYEGAVFVTYRISVNDCLYQQHGKCLYVCHIQYCPRCPSHKRLWITDMSIMVMTIFMSYRAISDISTMAQQDILSETLSFFIP